MLRAFHLGIMVLAIFALVPIQLTTADLNLLNASGSVSASGKGRSNSNLKEMLLRAPVHDPTIFDHAYRYIQEMQASTPCQQLATSTLIDGCQSLTSMRSHSAQLSGKTLDDVKREYSSRLAVCELRSVEGGVPDECAPFKPSSDACGQSHTWMSPAQTVVQSEGDSDQVCYVSHTTTQLNDCYSALFDTQQMWTSLSNALNNAHIICQASRSAVENDEFLAQMKDSVKAQHDISNALSHALNESTIRLQEHFEFVEAVRQFQAEIVARNEALLAQTDTIFARLMTKLEMKATALFGSVTKSTSDAVNETRAELKALHDEAIQRDQERADLQEQGLRAFHERVEDMMNSLDNLRDLSMDDLAQRLTDMHDLMKQSTSMNRQSLEQQRALHEKQNRIMELQANVESSLANQQEIINESARKLSSMSFMSFEGMMHFIARLAPWLGWAVSVLIVMRWSFMLAACLACGGGATIYLASWVPEIMETAPELQGNPELQRTLWTYGLVFGMLVFVMLFAGIFYRLFVRPSRAQGCHGPA